MTNDATTNGAESMTTACRNATVRWDRKPFRVERWNGKAWEHVDGHMSREAAKVDVAVLAAETGVEYRVNWG